MADNYPPGVTGSEPQIAGDSTWETWAESLQPGDRCEVVWCGSPWPARFVACTDDGDAEVDIETARDHFVRVVVSWDDVEQPEEDRADG